jgi:hypothetical protein
LSEQQRVQRPARKKRSSQEPMHGPVWKLFVRHRSLWVALLVLAILYAIIRVGMSASGSTGSSSSTGHPPSAYSMVPARVGGTVIIDDLACTLVRVEPLQSGPVEASAAGQTFVLLHMLVANVGSKSLSYNIDDFHIAGVAPFMQLPAAFPTHLSPSERLLSSGTLRAGESAEGDLIFQVAAKGRQAQLLWRPASRSNLGGAVWVFDF